MLKTPERRASPALQLTESLLGYQVELLCRSPILPVLVELRTAGRACRGNIESLRAVCVIERVCPIGVLHDTPLVVVRPDVLHWTMGAPNAVEAPVTFK
jgi:hypothetical protein